VAFDEVDRQIKGVIDLLEGAPMLTGGLRLAVRRLSTADHDLHFALCGGDDGTVRPAQVLYRQSLALRTLIDDVEKKLRWVYMNQDALDGWLADVKAVRQAAADFQKLQDKKAARDNLKQQFVQMDKVWSNLIRRYNGAGAEQYLLLNSFARVDRVLARLAPRFGIKDRRAPLTINFYE